MSFGRAQLATTLENLDTTLVEEHLILAAHPLIETRFHNMILLIDAA